ncbi:iron-containing alcohol dehydrogenase [Shewanella sp. NIFS-20-20]|uniref:iron-containing alcohol dehydrogenase n=1 Tax=Shewanella sp. NIFS-20-20 TaxID=2853806 RepID=UPI001C4961C8|nr:iron-containing alcohol dehydrogenase [Shewanella sp. NIFS-20-20]MBV7315989.1 iron-containing alcohol dehydrogenase [Shewanella sp. NIFS-20-20]
MFNFDYYNPTRICFGQGQVQQLQQLVPTDARVLILFGGHSARRSGTLDEVHQALGQRQVFEFGGIEPNPSDETLMQAVTLVKQEQIDFLLAVGGGSVIDGTKFVAAAAVYDGDPWEILQSFGAKVNKAMPLGAVLTLPATGSEMNNAAVVTRQSLQAKLPFRSVCVYPQFSILDPSKTFTLPERQVANGVVDAFVHITEQYLTYPVNAAVQDKFAEGLLQILIELGPQALSDPQNYDIRANLMWVATTALNGTLASGVPHDWASHMIGHELTALYNIDHARTLAIVLPSLLTVTQAAKRAKLLQYAERVWNIHQGSEQQKISQAIVNTREYFEAMGLPTRLSDYDLGVDDIEKVLSQLQQHGMVALGEHEDIDISKSRDILTLAL